MRLTTENYMLPYEEILTGKTKDTPIKMESIPNTREAVIPEQIVPGNPAHVVREVSDTVAVKETVAVNPDPVVTEVPTKEQTPVVEPAVEVSTPAEDTQPEESTPAEPDAPAAESDIAENTGDTIKDPYAGMTKAERKAARRAERDASLNKTATEQ
ncbi:MAG: hypothetical protein NC489_08045 [Ruminococcus flavefaciens]|nr:hypothetical protein [Ruminococcus flavefaciens]